MRVACDSLFACYSQSALTADHVSTTCGRARARLRRLATTVSYVSREEMHDAKVPLDYRDYCAHLLIPLNRCRQQEMYLPWKCETLRNAYEKCQHNDYMKRRAIKAEQSE